jgi:hypothetical protein
MDMITLFTILMMTVAVGATAMACVHYIIARNEIKHMRTQLVAWMNEFSTEADRRQLLNGKMATAMAERVRALETYRVHQTDRLNGLEDMVDLFNDTMGDGSNNEFSVQSESDWVEGRNERAGLSQGLSRRDDFGGSPYAYEGTMQDDFELDNITAERRRHVLDETAMHIQIEDMEGTNPYDNTPSMRRYVDTIASQLDDHGNIIRR